MSLKSRTTLALVLPLLACFGVFGWFAYDQTRDSLLDASVRQLEAIADLKVRQVDRLLALQSQEVSVHATVVAGTFDAHRGAPVAIEAMEALLLNILEAESDVAAAHLVDEEGVVFASTILGAGASTMPDELGPFVASERRGLGTQVKQYSMNEGETPRIVITEPVDANRGFVGTLVVRFEPTPLLVAIETGVFGETGELLLAYEDDEGNARFLTDVLQREDAAGTVLAFGDRTDIPMVRALRGENGAWTEGMRDYAGNDVIAVTRHIDALGWGLVAGVDRAEAILPARQLRNWLFALALVLAALATAAGRYYGTRLAGAGSALEAELALRGEAEGRFREVLETSPTAMLSVVTGGGTPPRITMANREAERLLGRAEGDLAGHPFTEFLNEASLDRFERLISAEPESEDDRIPRIDARILHDQGVEVDVELSVTSLTGRGVRTLLLTLVDVSERKEAERALKWRAEELARSNQELDRFAYVASHDLKAPLRSVDQLASFIEEDARDYLPEDSLEDLSLIRGRVARLEMLLDGLLEYSQVGRKQGQPSWVDVRKVLDGIEELYTNHEDFTIARVGPMPSVWAPEPAVDLVLRNMIMNAVKHHDRPNGVVRIEATEEARHITYFIEDDGPGIPAEQADRIFGLFETLRPRDEVEASGIGLSIVRKTMETYGGSIEFVPSKGRGARFALHFSRAASLRLSPEEAA